MSGRLVPRLMIAMGAVALLAAMAAPAAAAPRTSFAQLAYTDYSRYIWSEDNDASGKCLDAINYGNGTAMTVFRCQFGANERWTVTVVDTVNYLGVYYAVVTFKDDYPGKCLDAWPGHGQQMVQWACDGTTTQKFLTTWYYNQFGTLQRVFPTDLESISYPGQCVDIRNWGADAAVQLWNCNGAYNQQWHW